MEKHLDAFSSHPYLMPLAWCMALMFHTLGKIQELFITVNPQIIAFTEWLSYILAIVVSVFTIIGYGYKFIKWLKKL